MSDISKCRGTNCPMKESCYRYTATDGMMQSYFLHVPLKNNECDMYWHTTNQTK